MPGGSAAGIGIEKDGSELLDATVGLSNRSALEYLYEQTVGYIL